jgi:hypothetical protein
MQLIDQTIILKIEGWNEYFDTKEKSRKSYKNFCADKSFVKGSSLEIK